MTGWRRSSAGPRDGLSTYPRSELIMENNVAGTGAPPAPSAAATASAAGQSQFPAHENPRVWLFSSGDSPIGISLARQILAHGDYVVCGRCPADSERENPRVTAFENFLEELDNAELGQETSGWKERFDVVNLDIRYEWRGIQLGTWRDAALMTTA